MLRKILLITALLTSPIPAAELYLGRTGVSPGTLDLTNDRFSFWDASQTGQAQLQVISPTVLVQDLGLRKGIEVQAFDADLSLWAAVTPATGVGTFLSTPTSANLAAAVTNETGTGALVFGTSPDFTTGITVGGVAVPTISSTNTLTNKTLSGPLVSNATYPVSAQVGTVLDFGAGDQTKTVTLTANVSWTTANLAAGKPLTLIITGGTSLYTMSFPAWKFIGTGAPANVAIGKVGILNLFCYGGTDATTIAAWAVEP